MKVILLTGVGEGQKRNELLKIKRQFSPETVSALDLKEDSLSELEKAIRLLPLFGEEKLVIAENAPDQLDLSLWNPNNDLTLVLLSQNPKENSPLLRSIQERRGKIINCPGEKELSAFPFLDCLIEQKKQTFLELAKLLETYGGIYTLTMIYYLLRRNILPPPLSSFIQKKIAEQGKKYNLADWSRLYRLCLQTEFKIKSGLISENLGLTFLAEKIVSGQF